MGLFSFFKKKEDKIELTDEGLIEVGVCPNCWGHSEYGGEFVEYVADRQIDIKNKDATAQKAFIQKFVEDRITGIRLINDGENSACPVCATI
ncbi:MAG: hypothetical protein AB8H03_01775 [Saprospiraceae bacterium]